MTIREALNKGSAAIASSRLIKTETPVLDASLLLAEVLSTDRTQLMIAANDRLSEEDYKNYQSLLVRRLEGDCIAYITGRKEFYGLDFMVNPHVLVPRPETEILVEAGLEILGSISADNPETELRVLDLCTGSGAVAIALKHEKTSLNVWASDISAEALKVAQQNCFNSGPVHFIESDLFAKIDGSFHMIISNPPYIPSDQLSQLAPEVQREPKLALDGGDDGLCLIRRIVEGSINHLMPGGFLLMEADPKQMGAIGEMLAGAGYKECITYKDLAGHLRVIGGRQNELPRKNQVNLVNRVYA